LDEKIGHIVGSLNGTSGCLESVLELHQIRELLIERNSGNRAFERLERVQRRRGPSLIRVGAADGSTEIGGDSTESLRKSRSGVTRVESDSRSETGQTCRVGAVAGETRRGRGRREVLLVDSPIDHDRRARRARNQEELVARRSVQTVAGLMNGVDGRRYRRGQLVQVTLRLQVIRDTCKYTSELPANLRRCNR